MLRCPEGRWARRYIELSQQAWATAVGTVTWLSASWTSLTKAQASVRFSDVRWRLRTSS